MSTSPQHRVSRQTVRPVSRDAALYLLLMVAGAVLSYTAFTQGPVVGLLISILAAGALAWFAPRR